MQPQFVFRHMDSSEALRAYAEERLAKIGRYFSDPLKINCTLAVEKLSHVAQFDVTLRNGLQLHASESTESMYSSIDMALAKMERQVRRYKDRLRDHKPHGGRSRRVRQAVFEASSFDPVGEVDEDRNQAPAPAPDTPRVVRQQEFEADRLTTGQAVMQMNLLHKSFLVFTNVETGDINVIYRFENGDYGLIETAGHVSDS